MTVYNAQDLTPDVITGCSLAYLVSGCVLGFVEWRMGAPGGRLCEVLLVFRQMKSQGSA